MRSAASSVDDGKEPRDSTEEVFEDANADSADSDDEFQSSEEQEDREPAPEPAPAPAPELEPELEPEPELELKPALMCRVETSNFGEAVQFVLRQRAQLTMKLIDALDAQVAVSTQCCLDGPRLDLARHIDIDPESRATVLTS